MKTSTTLLLGLVLLWPALANANFIAYNDLAGVVGGGGASGGNVTNIGLASDGNDGTVDSPDAPGYLKDYATGADTPVLLTITANKMIETQKTDMTNPTEFPVGSDAYNEFYGKINPGWMMRPLNATPAPADANVVLTLSGLNPNMQYIATVTGGRWKDGQDGRWGKFTLGGADAFANQSTAGVTISDGGASSEFDTGQNHKAGWGYVARWGSINPGADGVITITGANSSFNSGSPLNVWFLTHLKLEEVPEPTTLMLLGVGGLWMLRRRR